MWVTKCYSNILSMSISIYYILHCFILIKLYIKELLQMLYSTDFLLIAEKIEHLMK